MGGTRRSSAKGDGAPDAETLLRELEVELAAPSPFHPAAPDAPAAVEASRAAEMTPDPDRPWKAAPPAAPESPRGGGESGLGLSEKQTLRAAWQALSEKLSDDVA
ncbi:MAG: hypothetical protein HQL51_00455 [Magnetococcales bacterium]|nr:hypothetical protein [Magnetococcales bacterium]